MRGRGGGSAAQTWGVRGAAAAGEGGLQVVEVCVKIVAISHRKPIKKNSVTKDPDRKFQENIKCRIRDTEFGI